MDHGWNGKVNVAVEGECGVGGEEGSGVREGKKKKKEKKRKREKRRIFVCESEGTSQPSASRPCKKALHGQEALFSGLRLFVGHDDRRQARECVPTAGARTNSCL